MSYTITTDVFCDNCNNWTHGECSLTIERRTAAKKARGEGWLVKGSYALCPDCKKKVAKATIQK